METHEIIRKARRNAIELGFQDIDDCFEWILKKEKKEAEASVIPIRDTTSSIK